MADKLDGLIAQIKKGQSLDAAAASVGAKVNQMAMTRQQAQNNNQIPPEQLAKIFQAKAGDLFASGAAVVKVASIQAPSLQVAGQTISSAQNQLARQIFDEISEEGGAYAQTKMKTKVNLALARQAIGASADAATPLGSAKPGLPASPPRAK